MSYRGPLIRVIAFFAGSLLLASMTWKLLDGASFPDSRSFRAVFTDVSGLAAGNDVRAAGISIGRVVDVSLDDQNHAVVTFDVDRSLTLTGQTRAGIKYKNLTGDRFLSLSEGIPPVPRAASGTDLGIQKISGTTPLTAPALAAGAEIPLSRTSPALDLDALFGGFQPLFEALTPDQVNRLSGDLVNALQGEGGTVTALLRDVADFTITLADRDAVIGQVVTNLNLVLGSVTEHSGDLSAALSQAQLLVSGLAQDRKQIAAGLVATGDLAGELTDTLRQVRPELVQTADQVTRLGALLTTPQNSRTINQTLQQLPQAYLRMAGAGSYGSFFNFYICGLGAKYDTLTGDPGALPMTVLDESRCT